MRKQATNSMRFGRLLKHSSARVLQLVGPSFLRNRWRDRCAVFAFHRVTDPDSKTAFPSSTQSISVPLFEKFAALIRDAYHPISYAEFEDHLSRRQPFPRRSCLITFDDGWRDNYEHAWPVLRKYELPALIFLPTSYIGAERRFWQDELYAAFQVLRERRKHRSFFFEAHELSDIVFDLLEDEEERVWFYTREAVERLKTMRREFGRRSLQAILRYAFHDNEPAPADRAFLNRREVAEMAAAGIDFGSHSVYHRILPGLNDEELHLEVEQSREEVSALTGCQTRAFSYPNGDFEDRVVRYVRDAGYYTGFTIDYGTVNANSNPYLLNRIDMTAELVSANGRDFSRSLFAIETLPSVMSVKRRRQHTIRPPTLRIERRIRLLYLIDSMQGEAGTEKQIVNLIRRLSPEEYEIHLACFVVSDWLRSMNLPCRIHDLKMPSFWRPVTHLNILRFARLLRRERIDIIQTFFPAAHVIGVLSAYAARVPRIITSRRNFGHALTAKQKWTMNIINRMTHYILANSFSVKQRTTELEGVSPRDVDVIYNGVDLTVGKPADPSRLLKKTDLGFRDDQPVIGMVANLRPIKGVEYFIEAAGIISRTHPQATYVLLGYGDLYPRLKKRVNELGIADRVYFAGRTPNVFEYLYLFDIAVLSSLSEGFSNSILEYMSAGLPVVATDVGSNWEAVADGVTGYLAQAQNAEDIAIKIISLLDDSDKRKQMGEEGRRRVQENFSMERMVERFDEYYRYIMTSPYRRPTFRV